MHNAGCRLSTICIRLDRPPSETRIGVTATEQDHGRQTDSIGLRGIHHACRTVSEMERSLGFYRDLIGLSVLVDEELAGEGLERTTGSRGRR